MPPYAVVQPDGSLDLGIVIGVDFDLMAQVDIDLTGATATLQTIDSKAVDLSSEITITGGDTSTIAILMPGEETAALSPSRNPYIFMVTTESGEKPWFFSGQLEVSPT